MNISKTIHIHIYKVIKRSSVILINDTNNFCTIRDNIRSLEGRLCALHHDVKYLEGGRISDTCCATSKTNKFLKFPLNLLQK